MLTRNADNSQRYWAVDGLVAACAGLLLFAIFANGRLDMAAMRFFFDSTGLDHWPRGRERPWSIFYDAAPWITASLILGGLGASALAFLRRDGTLQRQAVFVVASVVVGPGLLVNGLFKDHWERPRPRDVVELGGTRHYSAAPLRGEGGKSFPCGHCSVGFLYALGWWVWRRRLTWALASLGTGLVVGSALGIGRMAAGGHFPSDIAWSAFIAFGVAHWLYWYVLKIPLHVPAVEAPTAKRRPYTPALITGLGAMAVLLALFVAPHGQPISERILLADFAQRPLTFEFAAAKCDVDIVVVDTAADVLVTGETHGFGLPGGVLRFTHLFLASPAPTLRYSLERRGWFTDFDARVAIQIPLSAFGGISAHVGSGNIVVKDRTTSRSVANGAVPVHITTDAGTTRVTP